MQKHNSQAIIAKARAMYGNRITPLQYEDLLKCRSVSELAGYLKKQTRFSSILSSISETNIHRGQLENLLTRYEFDNYGRLYRYLSNNKQTLFHFVIVLEEIKEILRMVLLIKADNAQNFILDLPGYLISRSNVDLLALARTSTLEELTAILKGSDYAAILERFLPEKEGDTVDYVGIEHAFYDYFYRELFAMVKKYYRGKERSELEDLLKIQIEMSNLDFVFRSVIYLNFSKEDAVKSMFPYYRFMSQKKFDVLLDTGASETMMDSFKKTPYAKYFKDTEYPYIEDYTQRVLYKTAKTMIHFSTHAAVVFYAYYLISQIELSNVINIVEGVRYQVPEENIKKLIIY